jgi:outer membrane protein OmpA-like peptidoglycan-associated protein
MEVYTGDEVSTGADSEAYVRFSSGGFIHMSENTDPLFNWISGGACLVVQVFTGQVFMEADKVCVETPHLGGVIGSQIALTVTPERTTLTVIEGKVTLQGAAAEVISSRTQVTASLSGVETVRHLSEQELRAVSEWRTGPSTVVAAVAPPPTPSPKAKEEIALGTMSVDQLNQLSLFEDVFFDFDKNDIRADQQSRLEQAVAVLRQLPTAQILIEGHCDPRGDKDYNLRLGLRRAKTVRDVLVARGVAVDRIQATSRCGKAQFSICTAERCWSQDRRVSFVITSK